MLKKVRAVPAVGHQLSPKFANPDLVDRIFDYLVQLHPELGQRQAVIKHAVREEFGGDKSWVRGPQEAQRKELAHQVLSLFNGRNASEVARRLNLSRATVYRLIKQAGRP